MEETVETTEEIEEEVEEEEGEAEETEEVVETEEVPEEEIEEAEEAKEKEAIAEVEEAKEVEKEKKELEEEIVEENFYTIPLSRAWISQRKKRAPKAMRIVKGFVRKHMKLQTEVEGEEEEAETLVISNEVNEKIWSRGIEKPPRRIRVRAAKDKEGVITVYLAEGD